MRILVTGGTGMLGNNIIRIALETGHQVVALVRDPSPASLRDLKIETRIGELNDREAIVRAAQGVDAIIHGAAHIHVGWWYLEEGLKVNEGGTRNVVSVAQELGLRMIHISTVNTLAVPLQKQIADEETEGDRQIPSTYVRSKRAAELAVEEGIQQGLNASILHPGFLLGPWDWKPSSGRMIVALAKNFWMPVTPIGGCSVCDVRDVAAGTLAALDRGVAGRHYILAGYNLKYFDLWCRIATVVGRPKPIFTPRIWWRVMGGLVGDTLNRLRGRERDFNSAGIRTTAQLHWYSSQRAKNELGYHNRPLDETLNDAADWLRSHDYF